MTFGPRVRTIGGLRVPPTKVAASKAQRRVKVLELAIFLRVREQQAVAVRTWGEHRGPC